MDELIAEISKNAIEKIRVRLTKYAGHDLVDARIYFEGDNKEWVPTKKGLSLAPEVARCVGEALIKAADKLESR